MKGVQVEFCFLIKLYPPLRCRPEGTFRRCRSMYIRIRKSRHHSRIICFFHFVGCPSMYVVDGAYAINIFSDITF